MAARFGGKQVSYINEKLAVYKEFLNGKTASVLGVGISNIPLIEFLIKNGANVDIKNNFKKK